MRRSTDRIKPLVWTTKQSSNDTFSRRSGWFANQMHLGRTQVERYRMHIIPPAGLVMVFVLLQATSVVAGLEQCALVCCVRPATSLDRIAFCLWRWHCSNIALACYFAAPRKISPSLLCFYASLLLCFFASLLLCFFASLPLCFVAPLSLPGEVYVLRTLASEFLFPCFQHISAAACTGTSARHDIQHD